MLLSGKLVRVCMYQLKYIEALCLIEIIVCAGFHLSGTVKDNSADTSLYSEQDRRFRVSVNFDRYIPGY